jgi:hypothetical protein
MPNNLSTQAFWRVIQAFKRDPVLISKDEYGQVVREDDFIDVSTYPGFMIIKNEVGVLGLTRLILNEN